MRLTRKILLSGFSLWFSFLACSPRQVVKTEREVRCPPVSERAGDTIAYIISFSEGAQRVEFISSLRSFLDRYPFRELKSTVEGRVLIRMIPGEVSPEHEALLSPIEPSAFIEEHTEGDSGMASDDSAFTDTLPPDTILPETGGKIRLYSQRSGIDGTLLSLVTVDPFKVRQDGAESILSIVDFSPKKVQIRLNGRVVDGAGRLLSALDLIEAWTTYVKKHPAEGVALFRYVEGVKEFVQGREAVIRGFGAVDQNTCYLRLTEPDSSAVERISTHRICAGIQMKLGPYYPARITAKELVLLPNLKTFSRRASLDTLVISVAADVNPILSFSLKKYDAIMLVSSGDIAYAAATLDKQATAEVVSRDRYFISCGHDDLKVRRYVASRLRPAELLRNVVKAEGRPLSALETDSTPVTDSQSVPDVVPPPVEREIRILFRSDDIVSRKIAEKLLADLSANGIRSSLTDAAITEYERALVERKYDIAVGWAPERILHDRSERLRLASIWFKDEISETERIRQFREIPLFSVERSLLLRKPAGLHRGALERIFASSRPLQPADY